MKNAKKSKKGVALFRIFSYNIYKDEGNNPDLKAVNLHHISENRKKLASLCHISENRKKLVSLYHTSENRKTWDEKSSPFFVKGVHEIL